MIDEIARYNIDVAGGDGLNLVQPFIFFAAGLKCWCRGDEASSRVAASLIFDMNELAVVGLKRQAHIKC